MGFQWPFRTQMPAFLTSAKNRAIVVVTILALVVATSPRAVERYGDRLQIALPLIAWGCEAVNGRAAEYFLRYAVMFTAAHATKNALGKSAINWRPIGRDQGMPSAHTSTAVLGASSLVHECLMGQPIAQGIVVIAAGFTGATRISAEKHDIWQVLAGAILGWVCDRAFRRPTRARRSIARALASAGRRLRGAVQSVRARISSRT
jgi:membrane-associated phospholipid phosphatase